MTDKPFALSTISPPVPSESDYEAIYATVMESARGRWFLQEYARRHRNSDTEAVLAAIDRIENFVRRTQNQEAYGGLRAEIKELAEIIAQARRELSQEERQKSPPPRKNFIAAERIQEIAWSMRERGIEPASCAEIESLTASIMSPSIHAQPTDSHAYRLEATLQFMEQRLQAMIDAAAAPGKPMETPAQETSSNPPTLPVAPPAQANSSGAPRAPARPMPRAMPPDLFAALKAMSPEERIALFT